MAFFIFCEDDVSTKKDDEPGPTDPMPHPDEAPAPDEPGYGHGV
jgi:hypothetical protein